ncbi:MAG: endonuclease/exonuclease/phosphatase family protein, partial [Candidatus Marinimicrobia bacterium]|nr:endonuclease/exonuclease/phosphatase family protein [Candidatus Neomarinimicrobiota bacterium]
MKFILPHIAFTGCLILFFPQAAFAQTGYTVRIMTYNLWNYGGESDIDNDREDDLRLVIGETGPDLLVVQEVENEKGYTRFLEDVMNHTEENWEGASFKDQPDTDYDI